MKLPKIAIENHHFTIVVFLTLLIAGVISFFTMPRMEDPPIDIPGASVTVIYPGANPVDLEQLIADPIEEALNEIEDIKKIETGIKNGIVSTAIEFSFETDPKEKFDEVVRQVNNIRADLPKDIYKLDISKWSSADVVIMHLALVSETAEYSEINKKAKILKQKIEKTKGVRKVEILACPDKELRISLDIEKMAQMNISIDNVSNAIKSNNANIPGGSLKISDKHFNIKTSGLYQDIEEIKNTVVSSYMGRIIYLRNIADIKFDYEDQNYYARFNKQRSVFITVQQKMDFNIFDVVENIKEVVAEFDKTLSKDISLQYVFDQSASVKHRVNNFLKNLFQGIFLVGLVIFLALGYRQTIMVIIAIPFSIFLGLALVDLVGFGFQQMTIAGLIIALGIMVDNSIAIVENIDRFLEMGYSKKEAAIKGTAQLGWPLITATGTTLLAFIPIITMPDKAGRFIQSMPVTVFFTLTASLFIALTLTPFLSKYILKDKTVKIKKKKKPKLITKFIEGPYQKILNFSLKNKALVIITAIVLLGGAGLLFQKVGISFFPKAEKPIFLVRVFAPEGTNINKTTKIVKLVEQTLDNIPEVKNITTNIGHGNPRIYYSVFPHSYASNLGSIMVELNDYNYHEFNATIAKLRKKFDGFVNVKIIIKEFEQAPPVEAPLAIKLTGDDIEKLRAISDDIEQIVTDTKGTLNIDNRLTSKKLDLFFNINKDKAGMYGVPIHEIDKTIRTCINGTSVSKYRNKEGEEFDIVLRLPLNNKFKISDFDKIYVASLSGKLVPLKQLANVELKPSPGYITHYNLNRSSTITADIEKDFVLDDIIKLIDEQLKEYPFPDGYNYKYTGEFESRQETFGGMYKASLFALIGIFALLVLQFRSFTQPLIIFSAIPFALIGSVAALYLSGFTFSFTAFIGLISLFGIVVNDSIILVDYTNKLKRAGKPKNEAIIEAGKVRFLPIILTSVTTIGGLLPLTLSGGTLWAPLGWTIIGGLFVSTALTLIVVPVLYSLFEKQ